MKKPKKRLDLMVSFRAHPELMKLLRELAKREERTVADAVRRLVTKALTT